MNTSNANHAGAPQAQGRRMPGDARGLARTPLDRTRDGAIARFLRSKGATPGGERRAATR